MRNLLGKNTSCKKRLAFISAMHILHILLHMNFPDIYAAFEFSKIFIYVIFKERN